MTHHTGRRVLMSLTACLIAGSALTACSFAGDSSGLAEDCSKVKTAMEQAKGRLAGALSKGIGSPQAAADEMRTVAADLRKAGEGIKDAELKSALDASAGDLEKMFAGGGPPSASAGGGLAQLDEAVQRKCSTG